MSNKAMDWATDLRGIKPGEKLVLILLSDCHNTHTGQCNPSQKRLSDESGFSIRAVQRHLESLENHDGFGLIKRCTDQLGQGRGSVTNFVLNLSNLHTPNWHMQEFAPDKKDICTRHFDTLDTTAASSLLKEEPEIEPERTVTAQKVSDKIWSMSPKRVKGRSSKAKLKTAVTNALKKVDPQTLLKAWQACLADPDSQRDDFKFVPAIDRWIRDGKYEGWISSKPVSGQQPISDLESCFMIFAETGEWHGYRRGFFKSPIEPGADYPDALYQKYKIEKTGEAA